MSDETTNEVIVTDSTVVDPLTTTEIAAETTDAVIAPVVTTVAETTTETAADVEVPEDIVSFSISTMGVGDFAFQLQEAVQNGFVLREDPAAYPLHSFGCEAHMTNDGNIVASEETAEIVDISTPNFGEFSFLIQSMVAAGYTLSTLTDDYPSLGNQYTAKMLKDGVVLKEKNKGGRPRGTTKKR